MEHMTMAGVRMVERAVILATQAHEGQVDKAGAPYILHPLRVLARMTTTEEQTTAVLHDVLEDTPLTLEALASEGIPPVVLEALEHLTKREGEAYMDFIRRCAENPIARRVKLADLEDNMDLGRIAQPTEKDKARVEKYRQAKEYLLAVEQS